MISQEVVGRKSQRPVRAESCGRGLSRPSPSLLPSHTRGSRKKRESAHSRISIISSFITRPLCAKHRWQMSAYLLAGLFSTSPPSRASASLSMKPFGGGAGRETDGGA